jgi:uncharacterized protein (DUF58 family)
MGNRTLTWLETRWVAPSYSGWILTGLALFFFLAATNTLTGWLYVMSGVIVALLAIAALLSKQTLRGVQISRRSIYPISAGEALTVELLIQNSTTTRKELLQAEDLIPAVLGVPVRRVVETLVPKGTHYWVYEQPADRRGIYRWHTVRVKTAAPLGLFWCRRDFTIEAIATVYPTILPLSRCPLIDELGREASLQINDHRRAQTAAEGLTRSLRPYRWGDSTRMIHWRTSARYGELRVRELETLTSGQEIMICLDSASKWDAEAFEQAVTTAASLYVYANQQKLNVRLWTAQSGVIQGEQTILETLAAIVHGEEAKTRFSSTTPVVWLTQSLPSLATLPMGSRWIVWNLVPPDRVSTSGLVIHEGESLQSQLQNSPSSL